MPNMKTEEFGGERERPDWMLGFEERDQVEAICVQCGALVVRSATYTSRHREWHVRNGS